MADKERGADVGSTASGVLFSGVRVLAGRRSPRQKLLLHWHGVRLSELCSVCGSLQFNTRELGCLTFFS